ncbi:response regulator containing a -like receiver domain protein and a ggdef domain protein [Leptolyngbya sp. Heron Island J]|uniref:response regulator transcription factor n=1 Tax=Leptolyngbya sp. Heron Island J TaxID=1385935 RepID=UPI0003B9EE24|nr:response regulator [Leptolyngbya sp. Heron Island J]ESA33190.1 response regulator containing a -like receiver domain protein and a ggdef domain protein [Leptolyngbya sp. Heron Island J]
MAKILLIDNDRASRQILEQALKLYEYDVVTTKRGDEGLTLAVTAAPDLIVMDIDAAGLNGWQAIKVLKESSPTWLIPVIAMAKPAVTSQLLIQTGFDAYVRKPVSARHILQRIETLLTHAAHNFVGTPLSTSSNLRTNKLIKETIARLSGSQCRSEQASVVYVENSTVDNQTLGKIVERAGFSYANISDPLQVLSKLMDFKPQLIFLELVLPVANGYELCAQIRRISVFKDTPIVIVTNHNRMTDRMRAKIVGASDFLCKPIQAKSVLKVLIKYLSPLNIS